MTVRCLSTVTRKIYYRRSDVLRAMLLEKEEHSKNKGYEKDD